MKEVDKNLSGKSDEIEFISIKIKNYFLLPDSSFRHRLTFTPRKVSFDRPKGYVSCDETWSFARRNLTFRATKPNLSQICILQTARLQINILVTTCQSTPYKSLQKLHSFRPKLFSFRKMSLIWGQNSNIPLHNNGDIVGIFH
jgi:hypothetical protein